MVTSETLFLDIHGLKQPLVSTTGLLLKCLCSFLRQPPVHSSWPPFKDIATVILPSFSSIVNFPLHQTILTSIANMPFFALI